MSLYSLHPSYQHEQHIIDKLAETSGRDLAQWQQLLREQPLSVESEQLQFLKAHGLGSIQANIVLDYFHQRGGPEHYHPEKLVDEMFSGKKAALRPIFDDVLYFVQSLGHDVKICPCKTLVPFYRDHVFAQLKPATSSRLELALCLRGEPFTDRLKDTGGSAKKDRITHRMDLQHSTDFDSVAQAYLSKAYYHE